MSDIAIKAILGAVMLCIPAGFVMAAWTDNVAWLLLSLPIVMFLS